MPNVPDAELRSAPSSPHRGRIAFSDPMGGRSRGEFKCTATLEIDGTEYSVALDMIAAYRADMLGFFEELGREWDGWDGEKEWDSEFAEMRIRARNDGKGIVILDVRLWWPPDYERERSGVIHVRAAALPRFAERMRGFLRLPKGGFRFIRYDEHGRIRN